MQRDEDLSLGQEDLVVELPLFRGEWGVDGLRPADGELADVAAAGAVEQAREAVELLDLGDNGDAALGGNLAGCEVGDDFLEIGREASG